jgi:hypothetical protein
VIVIVLMVVNIYFYLNLEASWSRYVAIFFTGLFMTWLLVQLFALAMYPRLIEPGFKLATRNALALLAQNPIAIIFAGFLVLIFSVGGIALLPLGWFGSVAIVVMLLQTTTHLILKDTLAAQEAAAE